MPLETPLLRVSRPVAACARCRTAKVRCDGKLPACTACEKSGRADQCSSANTQFAPGKERSYVATLEAKVERLQKRVDAATKRRQSTVSMLDVISPVTPILDSSSFKRPNPHPLPHADSPSGSNSSLHQSQERRAKVKQELASIDDIVSDFGFLTVNATARDLTYNFTHSVSYAKLILAASTKEPLSSSIMTHISPQNHTQDTILIKFYVDHVCQLLPILEETEIWTSWLAISSNPNSSTFMEFWTCRLVLAISTIMKSKQRGDFNYMDALGHINAALQVAEHVLHPGSIYSIQAMLLLVQYSMLDPSHFDSWTLVGAASRATIDLGIHQDPSKSANTRRSKLELRRRIYHCVYALDRSISIVQTRKFSFSDDSANVGEPFQMQHNPPSLPQNGALWARSYHSFLAHVRLRQIQSEWYTVLHQTSRTPLTSPYGYIWSKYHEMRCWYENLPQNILLPIKEFFELDLLYSYVYILGPSPGCPFPSEHAQRLIIEHCSTYIRMIESKLAFFATNDSPCPFSFSDALRAYMMGRNFVDTLSTNIDRLLTPILHPSSLHTTHPKFDGEIDPFTTLSAPALPVPEFLNKSSISPAARAIDTIKSFFSVLNSFSLRFGVTGISWHEKFHSEATPLLNSLQDRLQTQNSANSFFNQSFGHLSPAGPLLSFEGSSAFQDSAHDYYPSPPSSSHMSSQHRHQQQQQHHPLNMAPNSNTAAPAVIPSANDMWFTGNEFGIDPLAAWKTLPGGSMNARFS